MIWQSFISCVNALNSSAKFLCINLTVIIFNKIQKKRNVLRIQILSIHTPEQLLWTPFAVWLYQIGWNSGLDDYMERNLSAAEGNEISHSPNSLSLKSEFRVKMILQKSINAI